MREKKLQHPEMITRVKGKIMEKKQLMIIIMKDSKNNLDDFEIICK